MSLLLEEAERRFEATYCGDKCSQRIPNPKNCEGPARSGTERGGGSAQADPGKGAGNVFSIWFWFRACSALQSLLKGFSKRNN